jgi:hypothetical protein
MFQCAMLDKTCSSAASIQIVAFSASVDRRFSSLAASIHLLRSFPSARTSSSTSISASFIWQSPHAPSREQALSRNGKPQQLVRNFHFRIERNGSTVDFPGNQCVALRASRNHMSTMTQKRRPATHDKNCALTDSRPSIQKNNPDRGGQSYLKSKGRLDSFLYISNSFVLQAPFQFGGIIQPLGGNGSPKCHVLNSMTKPQLNAALLRCKRRRPRMLRLNSRFHRSPCLRLSLRRRYTLTNLY